MKIAGKEHILTAVITLSLACILILANNFFSPSPQSTNFAVLDVEKMILDKTFGDIKTTVDPEAVRAILSNGRKDAENWLQNDLHKHCASPCVVLSRSDVVFGDVIDLNKAFLEERAAR